jgi:hypothetical protein
MSHLFATAGSKLYIGNAPMAFTGTDFVVSDFNAVVWTNIGRLSNMGSAGDSSQLVTFDAVGEKRTRKLKGTRNAGAMQIVAGLDYADPGQIALIAAEKTDYTYPFKFELNDAPPGGSPSLRFFTALVMGSAEQYNEANSVMQLLSSLEVDSNYVKVNASAGGAAPVNTLLPAITGTAEVGQTLAGSNGTWTGTPTPSLTRQWFADGESLPAETASTLVLTAGHEGAVITFMVTATNYHGIAHAVSAPTSAVTGD